jgi:murein DD-endopeptidase MepM/ murein hydrolase activator NlpD
MGSGTEFPFRSVIFTVRGGEMASKKALVASSLSLCTASWLASGQGQAVHAADDIRGMNPSEWEDERVAQAVLYQYLSPISSVAEGNLATKKESKPLTYKVRRGDTLYGIGKVYGVDHRKLAAFNRIKNPRLLQVGKVLKLPLKRKWVRVKEGETLESLAKTYKTSEKLLKKLNPGVAAAGSVYTGQVIAVPSPIKVKMSKVSRENGSKRKVLRQASAAAGASSFSWPVWGQITSRYGWRNGRMHNGIDIWNEKRTSSVIRASLGGRVIKAGYSNGYGNLVVVDHGNGWVTYYAHLSRITVSKGQVVSKGQSLGYMGQTGNATGVHLHFEVRRNGRPVNPLSVLP